MSGEICVPPSDYRLGLYLLGASAVFATVTGFAWHFAEVQHDVAQTDRAIVRELQRGEVVGHPVTVEGRRYEPPYIPDQEDWFKRTLLYEAERAEETEQAWVIGAGVMASGVVGTIGALVVTRGRSLRKNQ
jgi:hypothetical protein